MTSAAEAPVQAETRESLGIIALNRPDKFNCLSSAVLISLDSAITRFEEDRKIRAVLLLARGKHFCTGADLDEVLDARREQGRLDAFITGGHRVLRRLEVSPLPIVAAVNGLCLAGGLELMLACDVVFAGKSAQMGCQHARYGLVPGWGGTQRLARIVGSRRALDLMFSGRWLKADEALAWGLVNNVVDDATLVAQAEAYCSDLARKNPDGLVAMKQLCRNGLDRSLQEGLDMERSAVVDELMSENVSEGLAAFQERREPLFR